LSEISTNQRGAVPLSRRKGAWAVLYEFWKNKALYAMFLPACLLLFCFNYMPMFGLSLVFKDFDYGLGIFKSPLQTPWYGNFEFLFRNEGTGRAIANTLINNLIFIFFNTLTAIVLAILLNEVTHRKLKSIAQSMTLLPYFISTMVISVFVYQIFNSNNGMVNSVIRSLGLNPIGWYENAKYWRPILTVIYVWKNAGYMTVIYLATITGIDATLYEAAEIDGAKRWQRIFYITLPLLRATMITMTLLALGRIMNSDFTFYFSIIGDNPRLYATADVLDTFIYRGLRKLGDFTMSGAASFIQSICSCVILLTFNWLSRKFDENAALF